MIPTIRHQSNGRRQRLPFRLIAERHEPETDLLCPETRAYSQTRPSRVSCPWTQVVTDLQQTLVFLIHAVKQFLFGFEQLNEASDDMDDGSAAKAFYMASLYNYISVFYLLDKQPSDPCGGTVYKALKPYGLEALLAPIGDVLQRPIGRITFGEIVRIFRNKAIVHTTYSDADLDRVYEAVNMEDPAVCAAFQNALWDIYYVTKLLPLNLIREAGMSPTDFGTSVRE